MHAESAVGVLGQGVEQQPRSEVGAADADAEDVGDAARAQPGRGFRHPGQRRHGVGMRRARRRRSRQTAAQRRMQGRTVLAGVDVRAIEQRARLRFDTGGH